MKRKQSGLLRSAVEIADGRVDKRKMAFLAAGSLLMAGAVAEEEQGEQGEGVLDERQKRKAHIR